jgi:hypothetical protein
MAKETIQVQDVDYHRNGVGGEGFHVVLFHHQEYGPMVGILFDGPGRVAVLQREKLAQGNIRMHADNGLGEQEGLGGNAWRGDHFEGSLRAAVKAYREAMDRRYRRTAGTERYQVQVREGRHTDTVLAHHLTLQTDDEAQAKALARRAARESHAEAFLVVVEDTERPAGDGAILAIGKGHAFWGAEPREIEPARDGHALTDDRGRVVTKSGLEPGGTCRPRP